MYFPAIRGAAIVILTCIVAMGASAPAFGPLLVSGNLGGGTSAVSEVLAYDPVRGGFLGVFASGGSLSSAQGLAFGPDGNMYVASAQTGQILRFDGKTGTYLGVFAQVDEPASITFGPDGNLYVVSDIVNGVVRFDGKTGASMGTFASASGNTMNNPFMAVFGPDGNLYVSSLFSAQVLRFEGRSGAYQNVFSTASPTAGPTGLLFTPDGRLLVSDSFNEQILSFDASTGAAKGVFASGGPLTGPSGLALGPNNDVYVANPEGQNVLRYALITGNLVDAVLSGTTAATGAGAANFLAFAPAPPPPSINAGALVDGILNAASFSGGSVAPGEILTIFGTGMGPAGRGFSYQLEAANGNIGSYSAGTRVLFDGTPGAILYAQANQVSVVAPFEIAANAKVNIQVEYLGQASEAVNEAVAAAAPGIFSVAQNGVGPGAILNQDGVTVNSSAHPAAKGSVVAIFATGGGQTNPTGVDGQFAPANAPVLAASSVTATIGGIGAKVNYSGGSPGSVAGLSQVNVTIPAGAPSGADEVVLTIDGVASRAGVTVAVE